MFPSDTSCARSGSALRGRLVRGLDLAVEFATLGEYGVEEVAPGDRDYHDREPAWRWPRPETRALSEAGPRRARPHSSMRPAADARRWACPEGVDRPPTVCLAAAIARYAGPDA